MPTAVTYSVVVPTLGRDRELRRLLESLEAQLCDSLEVVVVDRSSNDRVADMLASREWPFRLVHLRKPFILGTSYAMNTGWPHSTGRYLLFADDDCWYPADLFARASELFAKTGADVLAGRAEGIDAERADPRPHGRYEGRAQAITRRNVWTTSIEWVMFFRREAVEAVNGFDETIGLGAATPWQAAPGQDIMLRAMDKGFCGYFDPLLCGFHPPLDISQPDADTCRKARVYGRGMGYILRRHKFGIAEAAHWIARPLAGAALYYLRGQRKRARYYFNMAHGRLEGWRGNGELAL